VLTGFIDDSVLAALYGAARCLVYVPLIEGFGLPALEAMHAALPVVASPMPSTGGAAREVDPLDEGDIARAIVEAAADDRVRSNLVTAGLVRARELTWERCAQRHVTLWQELVA
jgi:alpha-1,3-rhamnosyl/mannosyltransferase